MIFDIERAKRAQIELSKRVVIEEIDLNRVDIIAGLDVSYRGNIGVATAIAYNIKKMKEECSVSVGGKVEIPYIPGLLAFREAPLMIKALIKLKEECIEPDILMVNGHGIAHPRRLGIASHLGVVMDMPSIGIAKSFLYGYIDFIDGSKVIIVDGRIVGYVVKKNRNEIYVSAGHKIAPHQALKISLETWLDNHRFPEPIYLADMISRKMLKDNLLKYK